MIGEMLNLSYKTPEKKKESQNNNESTKHTYQTSKRKPIFKSQQKKLLMQSENLLQNIFNIYHGSFQEQDISEYQVFSSDFCGCEDPEQPCYVLRQCLLPKNRLQQMRQQYKNVLSSPSEQSSTKNLIRKRNLFKSIPKNYPQIFLSQINNLLELIHRNLTPPEFDCLCWIQYHAKLQYFTYYLFCDMKKGFNNFQKFRTKLNNQLNEDNLSLYQIQYDFKNRGYGDIIQKFIEDYYDSIGAKLLPMTAYAKFIQIIYTHGHIMLVRLLKMFMVIHKEQLYQALRYLSEGDNQGYRNYLKTLNWQIYFEQLKESSL